MPLHRTHSTHIKGLHGEANNPEVEEIEPPPWVLDGNSVQLERELVRLKSNALQYGGVTRGVSKRLSILKYVASGGK